MQHIETKQQLERIAKGQVISIGNFDGVHIGHQELLSRAKETAKKHNTTLAVITFSPHPAAILRPENAPRILTPLPLKQRLLAQAGVDYVIVLTDTYDLLNLSPKNFVDEFLMKKVHPAAIVEGVNFTFGYGRSGNVLLLRDMGKERGFEVVIVQPKEQEFSKSERHTVSSSLIRSFVEKGNVKDAAVALGRPYRLIGQTIPGRGKGTEIGYPTANIEPLDQVFPAEGVYAGFVELGDSIEDLTTKDTKNAKEKSNSYLGKRLPAAISIGRAKTFVGEHPLLFEAHILNADYTDYAESKKQQKATEDTENTEVNNNYKKKIGNLYGKWLAMDFIARIRPQHRFESVEALKEQIAKDIEQIKRILATEDTEK
jgi:riboflavin kinase/FMN adenylyltransferase